MFQLAALSMKLTALNSAHKELNAKMVDFVGWDMPLLYSSIQKEHFAVRQKAGLFDVSHMGELTIKGEGADDFLSWVLPNNIRKIKIGAAFYSHISDHNGMIIDDTIAMRVSDEEFFLIPNASNTKVITDWFDKQNSFGVEIIDRTYDLSCLALQGPLSGKILRDAGFIDREMTSIPSFTFVTTTYKGTEFMVSRTGYTGEVGVEMFVPNDLAPDVWSELFAAGGQYGLAPCGLGCRDTLRLEKGYLLSGQDFHLDRTTLETGWKRFIHWDKEFIGKEPLEKQLEAGDFDRFKGFLMKEKGIPRTGSKILANGEEAGIVTSGTMSPILKQGIALGYVRPGFAKRGTELDIIIRDKAKKAEVIKLPFV